MSMKSYAICTLSGSHIENGCHLEILSGLECFLVKWPTQTAHANFQPCITNGTVISLSHSNPGDSHLENDRHLEISSGWDTFLVKWPVETAHANFHAFITNWMIMLLSHSTMLHLTKLAMQSFSKTCVIIKESQKANELWLKFRYFTTVCVRKVYVTNKSSKILFKLSYWHLRWTD